GDDVRCGAEARAGCALPQQMAVLVLDRRIRDGGELAAHRPAVVDREPALDADPHRMRGRLVAQDCDVIADRHRADRWAAERGLVLLAVKTVRRRLLAPVVIAG